MWWQLETQRVNSAHRCTWLPNPVFMSFSLDMLCLCLPLCWTWWAPMIQWAMASRTTTCSSVTTGSSWWNRLYRSLSWRWSMTEGFPSAPPHLPAWRNKRYNTRPSWKIINPMSIWHVCNVIQINLFIVVQSTGPENLFVNYLSRIHREEVCRLSFL